MKTTKTLALPRKTLLAIAFTCCLAANRGDGQTNLPLTNDVPIVEYGMRLALCDNISYVDSAQAMFDERELDANKNLTWILHNTSTNMAGIFFLGMTNSFDFRLFNLAGTEIPKTEKGKLMSAGPKSINDFRANGYVQRQSASAGGISAMDFPRLTELFEFPSDGIYTLELRYWGWNTFKKKFILSDPDRLRVLKKSADAPVKTATNDSGGPRAIVDPDLQAMIDSWPKGLPTNGLVCAAQLIRSAGAEEPQHVCYVNVINTTTNFFRHYLNLPREALLQIELLDTDGKYVEKTAAGNKFETWTQKQIEDWYQEATRVRWHGKFLGLLPLEYAQANRFSLPEIFQLKQPGEYTLHLRMQLVEITWDASNKIHLQTTWLPGVAAKVQIRPEDIRGSDASTNATTNAPIK